jgi:hypothetical protein
VPSPLGPVGATTNRDIFHKIWVVRDGQSSRRQGVIILSSISGLLQIERKNFNATQRKKATTIAVDPEMNALLIGAAAERGLSRSEFIRQQLVLVLEQYRR